MLDVNVRSEHVNVGSGIRATGDDMSIDLQPQQTSSSSRPQPFYGFWGSKWSTACSMAALQQFVQPLKGDWLSRIEVFGSDAADGSGFVRGCSIEAAEGDALLVDFHELK